jgi:transcription factor STE12
MDQSYYPASHAMTQRSTYYSSPQPQAHQHLPAYSNPSSVHSSPRSYPSDLELELSQMPYSPPLQYQAGYTLHSRPKGNTFPGALQVTTAQPVREHDPSEYTARPGNAHAHAVFHSQSLPLPGTHTEPPAGTPPPALQPTEVPSQGGSTAGFGGEGEAPQASSDSQYTTSTPGLSRGLTRPLTTHEQERLTYLDRLKFFLATAPSRWDATAAPATSNFAASTSSFHSGTEHPHATVDHTLGINPPPGHPQSTHPALNRFLLPSNEYVTCVLWNSLYHITGTDIVRALVFRFEVCLFSL